MKKHPYSNICFMHSSAVIFLDFYRIINIFCALNILSHPYLPIFDVIVNIKKIRNLRKKKIIILYVRILKNKNLNPIIWFRLSIELLFSKQSILKITCLLIGDIIIMV
ncbi:hypothetical protein EDEG_00355 [Edhazardia aedis USNM 41457]|uniref:Uncharacterized protein n=1 Tax=Edhazardia aedis (strain USNM 41457) TaxID=1003232 RepID=J9D2G0_EDHAE|nr:hypothetical protein EDEG_00355 [Edhazardia aedis USNM 41457]|eukprot:EJW01764.1 hypothetical protein EDEG_00355 [Edhazardia aedis USNM 41457]